MDPLLRQGPDIETPADFLAGFEVSQGGTAGVSAGDVVSAAVLVAEAVIAVGERGSPDFLPIEPGFLTRNLLRWRRSVRNPGYRKFC